MSSLKEIKGRIDSVNNTLKITSAMRLISSSKFHRAQIALNNSKPYLEALIEMFSDLQTDDAIPESEYSKERALKKAAVVIVSSNASLCGSFNINVEKLLHETIERLRKNGAENITIYTIGKRITSHLKSPSYTIVECDHLLSEKPDYSGSKKIAVTLMKQFSSGEIDRVDLIYNHFKSMGTQIPTVEQFLPIITKKEITSKDAYYLYEPDKENIAADIIGKQLFATIFRILLDSSAAEHAARSVAMQLASDNAGKLIQELTLQYNKSRQQAITNELLDIVGGSTR
ncbi:ATP synthase gamma chain [Bacteroidales bacterium CF]|jgi:ATP synthase, F1 gamma subunit|nr:ATP synthase gamma chain [Bacteroidales bacterium CF]